MSNKYNITVGLVIFACLDFREFVILGLFTKSRIGELSISMIGSAITAWGGGSSSFQIPAVIQSVCLQASDQVGAKAKGFELLTHRCRSIIYEHAVI